MLNKIGCHLWCVDIVGVGTLYSCAISNQKKTIHPTRVLIQKKYTNKKPWNCLSLALSQTIRQKYHNRLFECEGNTFADRSKSNVTSFWLPYVILKHLTWLLLLLLIFFFLLFHVRLMLNYCANTIAQHSLFTFNFRCDGWCCCCPSC